MSFMKESDAWSVAIALAPALRNPAVAPETLAAAVLGVPQALADSRGDAYARQAVEVELKVAANPDCDPALVRFGESMRRGIPDYGLWPYETPNAG